MRPENPSSYRYFALLAYDDGTMDVGPELDREETIDTYLVAALPRDVRMALAMRRGPQGLERRVLGGAWVPVRSLFEVQLNEPAYLCPRRAVIARRRRAA